MGKGREDVEGEVDGVYLSAVTMTGGTNVAL